MLAIPTQPIPAQSISVTLANQACRINLYSKTAHFDPTYGTPSAVLFCDLYVTDTLILAAVPCWNGNRIVRDTYLGFAGDLAIFDTAGTSDPQYTGLGSRWQLVYLTTADLAALGYAG